MRTWQGWLYVALVVDCCSRAIVGYAMADHYKTPLITEAIEMAARNIDIPDGGITHSDYAEVQIKPRMGGLAWA